MSRILLKWQSGRCHRCCYATFQLFVKSPIVQLVSCLLGSRDESSTEHWKLFVGFQSAKAFAGFEHGSRRPAQCH